MAKRRQVSYPKRIPAERSRSSSASPYTPMRASELSYRGKISDVETVRDEDKLARILRQMVADAEQGDNYLRFKHNARQGYLFWKGAQWLTDELDASPSPAHIYRATRNICFGTVETIRGHLTDLRPLPVFSADFRDKDAEEVRQQRATGSLPPLPYDVLADNRKLGLTDRDIARRLTDFHHAELDFRNEEDLMCDVFMDLVVTGMGVRKLWWNRKEGRTGVTQYDPCDFLIDPECSDKFRKTARYVVLCKEMDADVLQRKYRLSKDKMSRVLDTGEVTGFPGYGFYTQRPISSLMEGRYQPGRSLNGALERSRVKVYEIWTQPETDFDLEYDEEKPLKRPNGSVFVLAGDVLLESKENPYGFIPIVTWHNYGEPRDPYGFGDLKSVIPNQIHINVAISQIIQNLILTANNQWIYEEGALNRNFLSNKPGLMIEAAKGQFEKIRQVEGRNPPQGLFQLVGEMVRSSEEISSVNDLMRGAMPQTHTPDIAVQRAQNVGFNRIKQKAKWNETSYKNQARMELEFLRRYWDFADPLERGEMELGEWLEMDERFREIPFDVSIVSKIDIPVTMVERLQQGAQMVQLGVMDVEELLDYAEVPVSDRFREKLRMAGDLQLMQEELTRTQMEQQLRQVRAAAQQAQIQGGIPGGESGAAQPAFPFGSPTGTTEGAGLPPTAGLPAPTAPQTATPQLAG